MGKETNFVENITPQSEDFSRWYTDVIMQTKLVDYSDVKAIISHSERGLFLILPVLIPV